MAFLSSAIVLVGTATLPMTASAAGTLAFAPFAPITGSPTLVDAGARASADFDRDGFPDLLGFGEILFGGPNPSSQIAPGGGFTVGWGDFNGDGNTDLIESTDPVVSLSSPYVVLGLGPGTGTTRAAFATSPTDIGLGSYREITVYDVNLDGADDILMWSPFGPPSNPDIAFGSVTGVPFTTPPLLSVGVAGTVSGLIDVRSADFDGDGFGDMVIETALSSYTVEATIYQGGPSGFTEIATIPLTDFKMVLGDVNGDGLIDIGTGSASDRWALQIPLLPANVPEVGLPALMFISATASVCLVRRSRPTHLQNGRPSTSER
jgi:hypothetical protein